MDATFPFGLSSATQFYLLLYVLTLVLHIFLMTYVLAGSVVVAWAVIFPGDPDAPRTDQPLVAMLRDWAPFVLSGAITAAVAPLLFAQVLYSRYFYTANLLLGWRWMVVIPALILAFYLLYLVKSKAAARWPLPARISLSVAACACFLFVAFCWTANHLLSSAPERWPKVYADGRVIGSFVALGLRLLTWVAGSFPTMCALAAWQLAYRKPKDDAEDDALAREPKRLATISLTGFAAALIFASIYLITMGPTSRGAVLGPAGRVWIGVLILGIALQAAAWLLQRKLEDFKLVYLITITLGSAVTLLATASLREVIRLSQIDLVLVETQTAEAVKIRGFAVFLIFTLLNAVLIGFCIWLVKKGFVAPENPPAIHTEGSAGRA